MLANSIQKELENLRRYTSEPISDEFLLRYIANSILAYIENEEALRINRGELEIWVELDKEVLRKHVENNLQSLLRAYGASKPAVMPTISDAMLVHCIAGLAVYGVNFSLREPDKASPMILMKGLDIDLGQPRESFKRAVENIDRAFRSGSKIYCRSRLGEICRLLLLSRQRFPDRTIAESFPLVDRLYVFTIPRGLPAPKVSVDDFKSEIEKCCISLAKKTAEYLSSDLPEEAVGVIGNILDRFFRRLADTYGISRLYMFQRKGIRRLLESAIDAIDRSYSSGIVLEAPTGAGKTEIFVISALLVALSVKIGLKAARQNASGSIVFLVYPRKALAADQLKRLLRYAHVMNSVLEELGLPEYKITVSINYGDVPRSTTIARYIIRRGESTLSTWIYENGTLIPPFLSCPLRGHSENLVIKIPPELSSHDICRLSRELCRKHPECPISGVIFNFVRTFKDEVYEEPGDIHITTAESLRRDLMRGCALRIFSHPLGGLLVVLDEVHLYTGVFGGRVGLLLDRLRARIQGIKQKQYRLRKTGTVYVGVSATLPNAKHFFSQLVGLDSSRISEIKAERELMLGNDYLILIVPTQRYLVSNLSVTIQAVMILYFNAPSVFKEKKALVFADSLDIVHRLHRDLSDAIYRRNGRSILGPTRNLYGHKITYDYGLQDLRNPLKDLYRETTIPDTGDDENLSRESITKPLLLENLHAWKLGELWWFFSVDYMRRTDAYYRVEYYTGQRKLSSEELRRVHILVTDSALEVGVDYSDIVLIYQHGAPPTLLSLVQRAGRGGRIVRENPLVRCIIAAQLSPNSSYQAALLELISRLSNKTFDEIVRNEKLPPPNPLNEYLIKQSLFEAIIDFLVEKYKIIDDLCVTEDKINLLLRKIREYITSENRTEIKEYLCEILSDRYRYMNGKRRRDLVDVDRFLDRIAREIREYEEQIRGEA